ncbi:MAG: hypothetical protein AVDCRST_MAG13-3362, partial [uncultured Solirubrobacteraceae bacterium]
ERGPEGAQRPRTRDRGRRRSRSPPAAGDGPRLPLPRTPCAHGGRGAPAPGGQARRAGHDRRRRPRADRPALPRRRPVRRAVRRRPAPARRLGLGAHRAQARVAGRRPRARRCRA